MTESLHGMFLVRKKNTISSVWHNFGVMATEDGRVIEKEQEKPICRTYGKARLGEPPRQVRPWPDQYCNLTYKFDR